MRIRKKGLWCSLVAYARSFTGTIYPLSRFNVGIWMIGPLKYPQSMVPAPDLIPAAIEAVGNSLYDRRVRLTRGRHNDATSTGILPLG